MKDFNEYSTVQRWMNQVAAGGIGSQQTCRLYFHFLNRFCDFLKKNPDEIINERREHAKSDDEFVLRKYEEKLNLFTRFLKEHEKLSPGSVSLAHNIIKSFFKYNYSELKVKPPRDKGKVRPSKVPSPAEVKKMMSACRNVSNKALIITLFQTGMGLGELNQLTLDKIKKELDANIEPIYLPLVRKKINKDYNTFIGSDAIKYLKMHINENKPKKNEPLFSLSKRAIEYIVKKASEKAKLTPAVTPHKLRAAFSTYLKINDCTDELVEWWMGHTIAYGGAYFDPTIEGQRKVYKKYEHAISITQQEEKPEERVVAMINELGGKEKLLELLKVV